MVDGQWTKYTAVVYDMQNERHETVHVYGMTEQFAREKLTTEYPVKRYFLKMFYKADDSK